MKKIMIIMLCVLLAGAAYAVSVGDVFTQEEFDDVNIDNKNLEVGWIDNKAEIKAKCVDVEICNREYWIEDMDQQFSINETTNESYYNGTLIVVNETSQIVFRMKRWNDLANETNKSYAWQEFNKWTINMLLRRVNDKKDDLKDLQTPITYDASNIFA